MSSRGAKVVGVSTSKGALYCETGLDIETVTRQAERWGSDFVVRSDAGESIEKGALLELEVDLLAPCARRHSIHDGNASAIRAPIIVAGANNPLSSAAEAALVDRGVVHPPDFVSNSGGVLGGTLQFAGVARQRTLELIDELVAARLNSVLTDPSLTGLTLRQAIEPRALARHRRVRAAAEDPSWVERVVGFGLESYRRGLIPKAFVSKVAPGVCASLAGPVVPVGCYDFGAESLKRPATKRARLNDNTWRGDQDLIVDEVIRARRSIRSYEPRQIPRHLIEEVLDLSRHAPSAMNGQPWRFLVIEDTRVKEDLAAIKEARCPPDKKAFAAGYLSTAPAVVAICVERGSFVRSRVGRTVLSRRRL